jgi:hypothetical protein
MPYLTSELFIFLLAESITLLLILVAVWQSIRILSAWNFSAATSKQYRLEKRAYLIILIITVALMIKIILLPFFTYIIDALAVMIPGAMCGAGVIDANPYGMLLLVLKLAILFGAGVWLLLNALDLQAKDYPFFRTKLWFFLLLSIMIVAEYLLDMLYLMNLPTDDPVACCSTIYGATEASALPFGLDTTAMIFFFYLFYLLSTMALRYRYRVIIIISQLLFLIIGYYAVVYFFGTYIYQLPTHQCPFCMLQQEYFYVGYLVWGSLFLGTFFALASAILYWISHQEQPYLLRNALAFNTFFVLLCSLYVGIYYLRNGVWLT